MEVDISSVSHSHLPVSWGNVVGYDSLMRSVRGYLERQSLSPKCSKCLVRSSPVVAHAYPVCFGPLHPHASHVTTSGHVHHVHEEPVPVALEAETDAALSDARYSVTDACVITKELEKKEEEITCVNFLRARLHYY